MSLSPAATQNLGLHEIDVKNLLGDGVFDLQARVHLDEGEKGVVAVVRGVEQELERAETVGARGVGEPDGRADNAVAQARRQPRTRRDLDELLVAALDRAFPLAEMHEAAMAVAENLDLDMAGFVDQSLGVERPAAEGAFRLGPATGEGVGDFLWAAHGAHTAAAAAGDRLQHDRRAEFFEERPCFVRAAHGGAFDDRRATPRGDLARKNLVAEEVERLGRRPDEGHARRRDCAGEGGVFGKKAVAGMDGVAARLLRQRDHSLAVEIGFCAGAPQRMRFVGLAQVQRESIVLRIDRHAGDPEIGGRASDADGDLAAIGDEKFSEGRAGHRDFVLGFCFGNFAPEGRAPSNPLRAPARHREAATKLFGGNQGSRGKPAQGHKVFTAPAMTAPPSLGPNQTNQTNAVLVRPRARACSCPSWLRVLVVISSHEGHEG